MHKITIKKVLVGTAMTLATFALGLWAVKKWGTPSIKAFFDVNAA